MPRVFLGNLPPDVRVEDIEDFFRDFGKVRNVLIKQGKYGFAEFDRTRDAEDAVYDMHGRTLLGSRITVELAKGPRSSGDGRRAPWVGKYGAPVRTRYRLRVENLSSRLSWQDLKDVLRKAGEVTFAEAHTERRGEGRVELASREDMERIVKRFQGHEINGRKIELIRDGGSRSSSRSRSRSKSRSRRSKTRSRSRDRRRSRSRSSSRESKRKEKEKQKPESRDGSKSKSRSPEGKKDKEEEETEDIGAEDNS